MTGASASTVAAPIACSIRSAPPAATAASGSSNRAIEWLVRRVGAHRLPGIPVRMR